MGKSHRLKACDAPPCHQMRNARRASITLGYLHPVSGFASASTSSLLLLLNIFLSTSVSFLRHFSHLFITTLHDAEAVSTRIDWLHASDTCLHWHPRHDLLFVGSILLLRLIANTSIPIKPTASLMCTFMHQHHIVLQNAGMYRRRFVAKR
jgi:hypothetical protein